MSNAAAASDPPKTNQRVRELYETVEGLTRPKIAELCRVSRAAVDRWLREPGSQHFREAPEGSVLLLEYELGLKKPPGGKPTSRALKRVIAFPPGTR